MGKTGWQAVAFFAIAWAVAASSIAWVNKGQIEHREPVETDTTEVEELRRSVYSLQMANEMLTDDNREIGRIIKANAERESPSRCIDGLRFRTVNGALANVGPC